MEMKWNYILMALILVSCSMVLGCTEDEDIPEDDEEPLEYPTTTRAEKIPSDISKRVPSTDQHPPILHSDMFSEPVPMVGPVTTAGAEDSPFILPDGNTFYFFFTPDVRIPPEKQLLDNVTGIWVSKKYGGVWSEPERVWLQDVGKLSLDGAHWTDDNVIWFASAREGYTGLHYFIAEKENGTYTNWEYADVMLNDIYQMGEMHKIGNNIYFHSPRNGGKGGNDIWMTTYTDGEWQVPVNIEAINTEGEEALPWVNADETEMFFTRTYLGTPGIFRSLKVNGTWSEPELIVSQFAGEPTVDSAGNLYFTHHFYEDGEMIEADIYYCERI